VSSSHTPTSYTLSFLVHAGVAGALFCMAWMMENQTREPSKVIELVAGAGDNYGATEAPALGTPEGSESVKVPNIPVPMPKIEDPEPPAASPIQPAPEPEPEPSPLKKAPQEPTPKAVSDKPSPLDQKRTTLTQDVKRISEKRTQRKMAQFRKEQAAAEARERAEAAKRMTKEEFDRRNAGKGGAGGKISKVDAKGIAGGVVGGSTSNTKGGAGGKALSVAEQNLLDSYFAFLKQRIKAAHVPPPGTGDKLTTIVQFMCAADGSLSSMKVVRSSGNSEFDESVIEAFRRVRSIGRRPDGKSDELELEFNAREDD